LLGAATLAGALIGEHGSRAVTQAVVWMPTGFAIATVWILGLRWAWVVTLGIFVHRALAGMEPLPCLLAGLGTTAEGVLGAWLLRRASFDQSLGRLKDVVALVVVAMIVPVASIASAVLMGFLFAQYPFAPFYSGWLGWWRMNALGALTVTPLVLAWSAWRPRRPTGARLFEVLGLALAVVVLIGAVTTLVEPGIEAVLMLYAVLPVALIAALRFGPRGAITTAGLATLAVVLTGSLYGGPFLFIEASVRHVSIQMFGLSLVSIPLVIGALIAEREGRVRRTEEQLELQARILELVARGRPVAEVLDTLVRGIETGLPGARCSVLLLEGRRLRLGSAPSLPEAYNRAIDGVEIGPNVGCCGTAAHEGRNVVAEDIRTDPSWRLYREVAERHGLRSCWSVPIRTALGGVVGTFALYRSVPSRPDAEEFALVERAASLVGIALERERREEQLRRAQKMEAVGKLAGGVAHDFNNLLTGITGFAESLRATAGASSELAQDASEILRATERGAALTRQLLTFSRQQVLTTRVLDLGEVVHGFTGMLQRLIGEDVRLVHRRDSGSIAVRADRSQLEQVLMNLVLNARDAMPRGGTLTITTGAVELDPARAREQELEPGPHAELAVHDTGIGMSDEVRSRAFDPFFTTKELGKGTGIGLSTVYGIVKQLGGAVWIESSPGAGATVRIWLRRTREEPGVESAVLVHRRTSRTATVLLAEDEPVVREFVQRTLERAGHQVLAAADGRAALELARAHAGSIDLVVTDVVMPSMGGPELVRLVQAERGDVAVLYLSGYPSERERSPESARGEVAFLQKPFSSARLLESVAVLIGRSVPGKAIVAGPAGG
jgi:signal transduction histidine kinase/integral membrane sensor domain MASE1/ActR/RegA family two-component response regulator